MLASIAHAVLYFLITFVACIIGALGGIGGGIIIKPLLDLVGDYPLANIGMLSSVTVLTMTVVSITKMRHHLKGVSIRNLLTLAIASTVGGILGAKIFNAIEVWSGQERLLGIIQTCVLLALVFGVFFFELYKHRLESKSYETLPVMFVLGGTLGTISSFLGIGGGPFNKPSLSYFLGFTSKAATVGSLCIIFFSQVSNVTHLALDYGLKSFDITMLPYMMVGAVLGGFVGGAIVNKINPKKYDRLFLYVVLLIIAVNILNLIRYIIG